LRKVNQKGTSLICHTRYTVSLASYTDFYFVVQIYLPYLTFYVKIYIGNVTLTNDGWLKTTIIIINIIMIIIIIIIVIIIIIIIIIIMRIIKELNKIGPIRMQQSIEKIPLVLLISDWNSDCLLMVKVHTLIREVSVLWVINNERKKRKSLI